MTLFAEPPISAIDPVDLRIGVAAATAAAKELGIRRVPPVRFFWGPASPAVAGKVATFEQDEAGPGRLRGYHEPYPHAVWIRDGMDRRELIVTAAHEIKHACDLTGGHQPSDRARERAAEDFGQRFADEFLARPSSIKSAVIIPETEVDDDGRFSATVRIPGMKAWTDLDLGLYGTQRRPLLVDDVAGMKSERVGFIEDAEARDEHLWFRAQLDKAERYKGYIARLLEQGRLGHRADALAALASRSGGSLTRFPLVFGTMRPLEVAA